MNADTPAYRAGSDEPTELDVVGIGNALVDVISQESDELIDSLGIVKGTMALIDEERATLLYDQMGSGIEVSGGSGANTMVGIAALGGRAQYIGKVREDQLGEVFGHDLRATGVRFDVPPAVSGPPTGRCLILVTPDAQRTMNTYLGASTEFEHSDIDEKAIRSADVLYLEGYLFDRPEAQDAFRRAADIAHDAGRRVAVTLSDPFCVERHRDAFVDLVESHVDLVFANELEALSLYECDDLEDAAVRFAEHSAIAAVTRSEKGSVVINGSSRIEVPAAPVERIVDTTGAGDLYAAGFLYGYSRGFDLRRCAELGSVLAAEVISHIGARPESDLAVLAGHLL